MIADEAERLANLLPPISAKKLNGRNNISKDLFVYFTFCLKLYLLLITFPINRLRSIYQEISKIVGNVFANIQLFVINLKHSFRAYIFLFLFRQSI